MFSNNAIGIPASKLSYIKRCIQASESSLLNIAFFVWFLYWIVLEAILGKVFGLDNTVL